MLPYLTRRSVVGVKSGTESGMTRADLNLFRTSAARAVVMPDVGHVCCRSVSRGEAYTDAVERRDRMNVFMFGVQGANCSLGTVIFDCGFGRTIYVHIMLPKRRPVPCVDHHFAAVDPI